MDAQPGETSDSRWNWQCRTGGAIPDSASPAFSVIQASSCPVPVLISVPHAGRDYTAALTSQMRDPIWAKLKLEDRLIDQVARAMAAETGAGLLVSHAPRALIDLNRAPDDLDWEMVSHGPARPRRAAPASRRSRSGLGLIPRRLAGLGEIWTGKVPFSEIERRIEHVHRPYHQALGLLLEGLRDRWGAALLIDLHSMPPLAGRFAGEPRPDFVVGDRFGASCDTALSRHALEYFAREGRPSAHNRPYAGGYVLDRHAQPARGIHCLQIEVCRSLYLDTGMTEASARLPMIARLLAGMARELASVTARLGMNNGLPLAAE